jgi:hypothetical protein
MVSARLRSLTQAMLTDITYCTNCARACCNRDLEALREPSALKAHPPTEREECRTLWQDVDTMRKKGVLGRAIERT